MKRLLTVLTLLAAFGLTSAKATPTDCEANLSVYYEYYKNKNYADAYKPWSYTFRKCPDSRKSIYIHGPRIVEFQIKNEKDAARKEALIDTLIMIYDQRLQYFPEKEGYVLGQKGADIYKYRRDSLHQAFGLLEKSFQLEGNETSSSVVTYYFQVATKLYDKGELSKERMIGIYENAAAVVAFNLENGAEKSKKYYQRASENIEKLFAPVASCDDLSDLYTERFEEHSTDADWLAAAAKMMDKKGCTDKAIYYKLSTTLYDLNPSAEAAANIAKMSMAKKDYGTAVSYFAKAIEKSESADDKASYYFGKAAAQSVMGQFSAARTNAQQAASLRPNWGEPYMLIGSMYADNAGKCGENDFERKAVYWAAIEQFAKAKRVDSSVASKADKAIAAYSKLTPDKTLTFTYGYLDKSSYTIGCWINETVSIPKF